MLVCGGQWSLQVSTATERVVSKLFSFPPLLALLLAAVVALSGVPVPAEVAAVTSSLAATHRPLVLVGLGLMVPLSLPRNQTRILLALLGAAPALPPCALPSCFLFFRSCSKSTGVGLHTSRAAGCMHWEAAVESRVALTAACRGEMEGGVEMEG
jgi:predicted permease